MSEDDAVGGFVEQFWTISKQPHDEATKEFVARCDAGTVEVGGTSYEYFHTGTGPAVLLVHGVHGHLGHMVPLAEELLGVGYRVVLFDAPAHGEAAGTQTNPLQIGEVIRGIADTLDDLHAIVAHSLGGLWTLGCWSGESRAKTLVAISTPSTMWYLVEKFTKFNNMDGEQIEEFVGRLESDLGEGLLTRYAPMEAAKGIDVPGLVVHGTNDHLVPVEQANELHSSWRGSRLEIVEEAGHYDIIESPEVRRMVADHLQNAN